MVTREGFQAVRAGVRSAGEEAHLRGRCVQEIEGEEEEGCEDDRLNQRGKWCSGAVLCSVGWFKLDLETTEE